MALRPTPSASSSARGETTIQPAYFTSSLFINALREDVNLLFTTYLQSDNRDVQFNQPYSLFKDVWKSLGWQWLHLKVIEPRARDTFLNSVLRVFLDRTKSTEALPVRAVALFGLYTFFMSQPSTSTPRVAGTSFIPISLDDYETLLGLPGELGSSTDFQAFEDQVTYMIHMLKSSSAFVILPPSHLYAQNPKTLPREVVQSGEADVFREVQSAGKKTGRPSKAEKSQKARLAVSSLNTWTESNAFPAQSIVRDPAGASSASDIPEGDFVLFDHSGRRTEPLTHKILAERPLGSLNEYRTKKDELLSDLSGQGALARANNKVLTRLKEIDSMAAEQGLEVGGEGGERSGLERVERAVLSMSNGRKGLLGLLEGEGLDV